MLIFLNGSEPLSANAAIEISEEGFRLILRRRERSDPVGHIAYDGNAVSFNVKITEKETIFTEIGKVAENRDPIVLKLDNGNAMKPSFEHFITPLAYPGVNPWFNLGDMDEERFFPHLHQYEVDFNALEAALVAAKLFVLDMLKISLEQNPEANGVVVQHGKEYAGLRKKLHENRDWFWKYPLDTSNLMYQNFRPMAIHPSRFGLTKGAEEDATFKQKILDMLWKEEPGSDQRLFNLENRFVNQSLVNKVIESCALDLSIIESERKRKYQMEDVEFSF